MPRNPIPVGAPQAVSSCDSIVEALQQMYVVYGGQYTRTGLVLMVLDEGGIPYELRELDMLNGEHRSPEFLAINPAGYVPAMCTPRRAGVA